MVAAVACAIGLVIAGTSASALVGEPKTKGLLSNLGQFSPRAVGSAGQDAVDASGDKRRPVVLSVPSIDLEARVVAVGVTDGSLQVPNDPAHVGWWSRSAPAGAPAGSVVMDGHVDSRTGGPGALYRLAIGDVRVGTDIVLRTAAGRRITYRVYAQQVYRKAGGLPAEIFASTNAPRLVLITCGGSFDFQRRSYDENVVVYARPTVA